MFLRTCALFIAWCFAKITEQFKTEWLIICKGLSVVEPVILHKNKQDAIIQKNIPQSHCTVIANGHNSMKDLMEQNIYNEKGKKLFVWLFERTPIRTLVWFQCFTNGGFYEQYMTPNGNKQARHYTILQYHNNTTFCNI